MSDDFLRTSLPVLGTRIHRLGLSCGVGIDDDGIPWALDQVKENLAGLEKGPLNQDKMTWMREYGKIVHG